MNAPFPAMSDSAILELPPELQRPAPLEVRSPTDAELSQLLDEVKTGDDQAWQDLFHSVYGELRQLADRQRSRAPRTPTLATTALVHETFLKLSEQRTRDWNDRTHFLAIAATAMHRVIANYAKHRRAQKRGGKAQRVELDEAIDQYEEHGCDLVALGDALERLREIDPQKCSIVEMRFFGGLSNAEIATALEVSTRTVERSWRVARALLRTELATEEIDLP